MSRREQRLKVGTQRSKGGTQRSNDRTRGEDPDFSSSDSSDSSDRVDTSSSSESASESVHRSRRKGKKRRRRKRISKPSKKQKTRTPARSSRKLLRVSSDSSGDESDSHEEDTEPTREKNTGTVTGDGIVVRDAGVDVPSVDRTEFESWEDLEAYLAVYWRRTYQVFKARGWTHTKLRNERMKETSSNQMIPDEFPFYCKTYVCTHSGKPAKSRGKGARPMQHTRKIECQAKINACVRFKPYPGIWEVVLTKQTRHHNHVVAKEVFQSYHEARKVEDDAVLQTVRTLDRAGANRKRILEFIMENSTVEQNMLDIHNLVMKLRKEEYKFPTIEERIRAILEDFASKSGNVARVFANDKGVVECISIQSAHMRKMFEHFPEILLIDATHDTNNCNYKLFSFMIHDAMGTGQHVQHCLLENERKATLRIACQQFKEACPSWPSLQVIMIDKDFTEMAVLEEEFPGVRVLLCQFHVVKYLQEEIAKVKYDLTSWSKKQMKQLFSLLVSAPTQKIFDGVIATMELTIKPEKSRSLWMEYFKKNWLSCKERWSSAYRGNVPHMGNTTNNRLESSWQKLKTLVNKSTALDDCVVAILFWQTVNETKWARAVNKIGLYINSDFDADMNALLNSLSRHAVDFIKQQYDFALKDSTSYTRYPLGPYQVMKYDATDGSDEQKEYMIKSSDWTCSCMFQTTRLLPCRHIIYYRKSIGCETLVPVEIVNSRWLIRNYKLLRVEDSEPVDVPYEDKTIPNTGVRAPKNQNEKFNDLLSFGRQIADAGSSWGTSAATGLRDFLEECVAEVRNGRIPELVRGSEAKSGDNQPSPENQPALPSQTTNTDSEVPTEMSSDEPPTQLAVTSGIDAPSQTGDQSGTEGQSEIGLENYCDLDTPAASLESISTPQWTIAESTKRSGLAKFRKKARKQAKTDGLKEASRIVNAVSVDGTLPSMDLVIMSYRTGWFYMNAESMSVLSENRHPRTSAIVVAERSKQKTTPAAKIHSMLALERVKTCETMIATFQNRYRGEHDNTIAAVDLSVKVDGYVFDIEMIRATKMWFVAAPKFHEVHKTLKWVANLTWDEYMSMDDCWTEICMDRGEMVRRLRSLDVMSDGFYLTTFQGEKWIESSALDLSLGGLISKWKDKYAVFTCPSWLFKFPNSELTLIHGHSVWKQLELAAADFGYLEDSQEDGIEVIETERICGSLQSYIMSPV